MRMIMSPEVLPQWELESLVNNSEDLLLTVEDVIEILDFDEETSQSWMRDMASNEDITFIEGRLGYPDMLIKGDLPIVKTRTQVGNIPEDKIVLYKDTGGPIIIVKWRNITSICDKTEIVNLK
jgi:hypothetical protein